MTKLLLVISTLLFCFAAHAEDVSKSDLSWVTVIYRVMAGKTIEVKDVIDGAEKKVSEGKYLEAYLPRSLFAANKPVTVEDVEKISPLTLGKSLSRGFSSNSCGPSSDRVNVLAKKVVQLSDGTVGEIDPNDLAGKNRKTQIHQVFTERRYSSQASEMHEPAHRANANINQCAETNCQVSDQSNNLASQVSRAIAFSDYSESSAVKNAIDWAQIQVAIRAKSNPSIEGRPSGCCAAYVSRALFYSGLAPDVIHADAKDMGPNLTRMGFINLMTPGNRGGFDSPRSAPKGAILVYSGGKPDRHTRVKNGHVEIKTAETGSDGYISDFVGTARSQDHKLIGIYIKP